MGRYLITMHGEKFEVNAPSAEAAYASLNGLIDQQAAANPDPGTVLSGLSGQLKTSSTPEGDYNAALRKVRETQFPGMSDEQWAAYSAKAFAPYSGKDIVANAQLLGFGDELEAGIGALGSQVKHMLGDHSSPDFSAAYGDYAALEQARRDLGRKQAGDLRSGALDLVGGLTSFGVGGAPAAAEPLLITAAKGVGEGATVGGLTGFGTADEDRLQAAGTGALIGGALGGTVPVVAQGVSSGVRNVADALTRSRAAREVGMSPQAAQMLQETMAVDDALGPTGAASMAAAGPDAMLADAGQSARNALDYAIAGSGRAGQVAREAIEARAQRGAVSINDALDTAFGAPQGVETTRAGIRSGSAQPRQQAYDAAYAQPVGYDTEAGRLIEDLLQRVPQEALRRAQRLMQMRGEQSAENFIRIADNGTVTLTHPPDVRQLDYVIRALNDEAQSGIGMGAMGGQTAVGNALEELATNLRTTLRNQVPEYDAALNVAADSIRQSQAVQRGSELLRAGTTRETVAGWVQSMTQAERAAMAQGIRSNIDDVLANVRRSLLDGNTDVREAIAAVKQLSSRANREKIALAIGDNEANALFARLDEVARSYELQASVATNTKTFQRQAMDRRVGDFADPDTAVEAILKGEPVNAAKRATRTVTGRTPARTQRRRDQIMEEIVRALVAPAQRGMATMRGLQQLQGGTARNAAQAQVIRAMLGRLALPGAGLSAQQTSMPRR